MDCKLPKADERLGGACLLKQLEHRKKNQEEKQRQLLHTRHFSSCRHMPFTIVVNEAMN